MESAPQTTEAGVRTPQGTLLQIELAQRTDWKHLARNSVVEGRLMLPVFTGNDIAIPEQTKVKLTIESVKKVGNDSGTWKKAGHAVVRAFDPLEKGRPTEYAIRLSKTDIEAPQGSLVVAATALRAGYASMIEPTIGSGEEVHRVQLPSAKPFGLKKARQTVVLQLDEGALWPASTVRKTDTPDESRTRKVRAFLLTQVSASHNRKDDAFQARLAEPVRLGGKLFEVGSLVDGTVSQSARPKMLSRAGSLHLRIDRITSPQGASLAVAGTLGGVEAQAGAKYGLDEEGGLHGLRPGVTNALVDLGIAYALGKVTDDLAETPIRAVAAAMSDAAAANAARYFGLGASAVFLITRHGRDVNLPRYSEIEIDFGRPSEQASATASLKN
ncbi:MAG: hypothetical protein JWO71_1771 [Candidatus Acidoferrum typicum]|nr:hypothetical protein [Candidatus Acidoferrum typicum]